MDKLRVLIWMTSIGISIFILMFSLIYREVNRLKDAVRLIFFYLYKPEKFIKDEKEEINGK